MRRDFWAAIEDMPFKRSSFALMLSIVQNFLSAKLSAESGTNMWLPQSFGSARLSESTSVPYFLELLKRHATTRAFRILERQLA